MSFASVFLKILSETFNVAFKVGRRTEEITFAIKFVSIFFKKVFVSENVNFKIAYKSDVQRVS